MRRIRIGKKNEFQFWLQTPYRYSRKRKKAMKKQSSDDVLALLIERVMQNGN